MKKNNRYMMVLLALITMFNFAGIAEAVTGVYVSPATATKKVGDNFNISVLVSETQSKVYAVEGTLVFNGLTCNSISVADGVTVQTAPTCAKPYFLLGIPSGTTSGRVLATVSVGVKNGTSASLNFSGIDVIGEGMSLSNIGTGGIYDVTTPVLTTPAEQPKPIQETTNTVKVGAVKNTNPEVEKVVVVENNTATESVLDNTDQTAAVSSATGYSLKFYGIGALVAIIVISAIIFLYKKKESK